MDAWQIVICIVAGIVVLGLIELWMRWRISRFMRRVLARAKDAEKAQQTKLDPECRHIVRLTDSEVTHERPGGEIERIAWSDLDKVEVLTTAEGPFLPDVFWVLHGSRGGCVIPQGATGDEELLKRLQALPGFKNDAFINAMSCTEDQRFVCWERNSRPA
jgi:hypothetical protein